MGKTPYQPPEQSSFGQFFDSLFLLALVAASLFAPYYLGLGGSGKTTVEIADKSWKGMGQNALMQAQWEKLGHTPATAAEIIATRFDYSFDLPALLVTAFVIVAYFVFLFHVSEEEYREVIAERFDAERGP